MDLSHFGCASNARGAHARALLPAGRLEEGVGNHLTFMFGDGARVLTQKTPALFLELVASAPYSLANA